MIEPLVGHEDGANVMPITQAPDEWLRAMVSGEAKPMGSADVGVTLAIAQQLLKERAQGSPV